MFLIVMIIYGDSKKQMHILGMELSKESFIRKYFLWNTLEGTKKLKN